jgi:hypothetical protein
MTALRLCLAFSLLATSPNTFAGGVSAYVNPSRPDAPVQTLP